MVLPGTGLWLRAGRVLVEAGRVPVEAERVPVEAGWVPVEAGRVPVEAGRVPVEAGKERKGGKCTLYTCSSNRAEVPHESL